MCIPEAFLVDALAMVPPGVPALVVGHHPLSWFERENGKRIRALIEKSSIAYLYGHAHEAHPNVIVGPAGGAAFLQAGALFEGRNRWAGYSIIVTNPNENHFMVKFRRWVEPRRVFADATDVAEGGAFYSSDSAKAYFAAALPKFDKVKMDAWRTNVLTPHLYESANSAISGKHIDQIFIDPGFEKEIHLKKESDEKLGPRVSLVKFREIIHDDQNCLISARQESGKTTFLNKTAIELSKKNIDDNWSIPVVLHFSNFKDNVNDIKRKLRQAMPDLPEGYDFNDALESGRITVLLDDVSFERRERKSSINKFVELYPKCRFIIATSTALVDSAGLQPEIAPGVAFSKMNMRPMQKKDVLHLIEKHGDLAPLEADQLLERLLRDARTLNVPVTAVTSTFLIEIFMANRDTPIDMANLIERYIDLVLERFASEELIPGSFNYKNKIDLLSYLAEFLVKNDAQTFSDSDAVNLIEEYLNKYGFRFNAHKLLQYFVESRILELSGGRIRFRLRMFFEWFVAHRMNVDNEFLTFIFDDQRFLYYPNEISLYCALNMRDVDRLDWIFEKLETTTKEIWANEPKESRDARSLESYVAPHPSDNDDDLRALAESLASPEEVERAREAILEGGDLEDFQDQSIARAAHADINERWIALLVLTSAMLKHLELVGNDRKKEVLRGVLDGWLRFTAMSLASLPVLVEERKVVINGIIYRAVFPENLSSGEVARRLAVTLPSAVGRMAARVLGTEKLQEQLRDGIGSPNEPVGRQFMRFAVLSDLRTDDLADLAVKVGGSLEGHDYLEDVLVRKLYEIAIRYRLPDSEIGKVRSLVGGIVAAQQGVRNAVSNRRAVTSSKRAKVVDSLRKSRLILDMQSKGQAE
ncbi:hypothetical protein AWH62_13855 [Maricaulis sp. W15]|nr:hypothetical protein AWH62_13855 [Maricaulis sp. W15]